MSWIRRLSLVFAAALSSHVLPAADKPILLVGAAGNPFSFYNAEILRAEGFNAFDTADIATVTATTLSGYDVVVLGQTVLTPAQVTMFTTWVNGGGYLIAMRPDKQLASLFGIADTGTTLSNGYLLVNTSAAPGTGIVGQTIQFHSTADLYLLSGASSVATLYSTRTASTPNPAVTLRTGIGSGGKAAAFMYDLARSVVYTRQGNPAWAGQARVGQGGPIRSSDMFYGNAVFDPQPDWVDLNNVAIPQADEQQRLLANLILHLNQSKKPLPRFWYFPFGKKAAVIMTGDDHAQGATAGRFDDYLAKSPTGCSVASWECIRGTSYIFPFSPLTNAQAAAYNAQGFEVGLHVNTNCASYTLATLQSFFASQLSTFATNYSGVPAPTTNRNHCIAFSDWSSTPVVQLSHGIRLDTNYYYWPPSWVVSTPGFFTGSGMPMRFAQTDGTTIDVYQSTTQMTDESGQAYPATVDGLLDNAIGSAGYYGAFNANMHTDSNTGNSKLWSDQIVSSALSRGVPVITAKQMLQWLDARNGSSFTSTAWSGNTLTFSIAAAGAANGLQAMLPYTSTVGPLSSLTRNGAPISFAVQTIKGIQYAFFFATTGTYQGTYGGAPPPVITAVTATPAATTATITWTTDKASNSRVDYGTSPSTLNQTASNAAMVTGHSVSLTGLTAGTLYYFRVTSVDATNGSTTSPPLTATAATFTTVDSTPPVITVVTVPPGFGGTATITWTTNELSTSRVDYGILSSNLNLNATNASMVTAHSITLTGLTAGTTYYFRVTSVDANNNSATLPASPNPPSSFVQTQTSTVSIWNVSAVPGLVDSGDPGSVELGMKFRSDLAGTVTGVRFYKAAANTGIHIGNLWSSTGTLLGSVTFTNETASGWQQANFAAPISIAANTTYIVSYLVPNGHYSADSTFFASTGVDTPPLHALANGVDGPNGLYQYSSTSVFPSQSYQSSNYWVDVVFGDSPPVISAVSAAVGATSATIAWTTNEASNSRVDYGTSPASLTTSQTNALMVTAHSIALSGLTTGTTYYYRVTSVDAGGNSTTSPVTTTSPATFVPAALPVITAVTATPAATTATITWTTDKSSNSRLDYGTSPSTLNQTASNAAMVTSHSVSLTGLTAGTLYYFRVTSVDATNGSTTSPPLTTTAATFMTSDSIPPVITAVTVPPGFGGTATIVWTTNELSTSRVDYGILASNLNLNATNASMVTAHSITLTGLTAGTTYYFRVTSVDAGNNSATLPASPNPPSSFVQTQTSTVSIWNVSAVPGLVDSGDPGSVELGMKFRSDLAGTVTGVRFYKAAANTGIHIGNLWSSTGTLLGSVTFTNETASGWQQANFAAPVSIAANTTYIVSYLVPNGHYSADNNFFASTGVDTPPLHALADGVDGLNGVYQYSSTSVFPSQSYQSSNYWVDVVFGDSPPVISAVSAAVGATSATITWTTNEASNSRVDYGTSPASLTTSQTNASMVTAHSIALSGLTTGTTYYYRVRSVDAGGNSTTSPVTTTSPATFVPAALPVITAVTATPAATTATITWATDKSSNSRVDYGTSPSTLNQTASNAAMVTSHSVSLTGLTAGTLYYFRVTSVDATNGSTTSPPLTATAATFMTSDSIPPVITAVTVPPGFGGTAAIIWTTNELSTSRVDYGILSSNLNLNATNASMVTAHSITLTGLTAGTTYYFRVTSVDAGNNSATLPASPNPPSSFAQTSTVSIWNASAVPGLVDSGDPGSVELGMKFRSDLAGTVTGVRFYKAAANTGIHIGNLWSSTGTLLGSVTFTNETASGWQQANFAAPVSIAANTTYIVSYLVPNGHYSADNNFFASTGVDTPPLHALANGVDGSNGVYQYSSTSVFPSQSYQSSNYWVDVVFGDSPPVISAVSAAVGATSATITWTTNEASNSRVDYGTSPASLTTSQTNASMVTAHSIALSGLTTGVTYYYRVTSVDAGGNSTTSPVTTTSPATFVPANAPQPVITAVTVIPGSTSAIITWTTNLASNSRVDYGITPAALNQIATNAAIVTSHSVAISGLTASSTYYYRVTSVTSAGGSAESPTGSPASFVTTAGSGGGNGNPPSEWDITGAGDATIQGFSTDISVNKGDTVSFKINTNATAYTIDVYRMGYYNGNGASKVATISPSAALPQTQPSCLTIPATGLIDCGNWSISASWPVPSTAKSGIYFAKIRRTDTGGASHIIFVVRDDASTSAILFQTSDTTWQAYNQYAGNSLYVGAPAGRAYKVSYNRPITTRSNAPEDFVFNAEYPMVRWLEANGYDVTYTTGVDSDRRGNLIGQHRLFLSVGHDEYWSAAQRANVEAARDSGTNIAFFSGNEVFWKTRWEDNNRTLVCYKETHANAKIDPTGVWTGTWRDPRFSPPADGGRPENRLTGTIFTVNAGPTTLAVQVPADDGKMRFWRNTGLQNQAPGATATLTSGTLGYEWDEDLNNGARPAGLIRLSTTQSSVSQLLLDYGSAYIPGTATHSTTLYRALSGALVFGAGTVQWMWGLDANHDRGNAPADARMQQAIVNLFADMGVQPSTLQSGLIPAAGSNDTTVPASTITSPAAGAVLQSGAAVTITGTATDSGGGVIGGIEVSVDGGLTWNRAVGRESWSYSWTPVSTGSQAIRVRATDDSLNTQSAITTVSVTVNGASGNSIWLPSATPTIPSDSDTAAVELGVKFRSDVAGSVRGVRFYKGSVNTGTHIGKLWTSTGTLLASVTFTNESASGWQQALFTSPVQITANTTYIVSYYAPNGGYAGDTNFFTATGIDSPPLHALRDGVDGPNGLYRYGTGGGFPASSFQSSNYWVDLVFVPQ